MDGTGRCEGSRQAGQGLRRLTFYIPHVSIRAPVTHPLDEERIDTQVMSERGTPMSETVARVQRRVYAYLVQALPKIQAQQLLDNMNLATAKCLCIVLCALLLLQGLTTYCVAL
jgi:hypothetical protein